MRASQVFISASAFLAGLLTLAHAQSSANANGVKASENPKLVTHSLEMPYLDQDLSSKWWQFGGDALLDVNSHIRLTADRPSQTGWIYSKVPLHPPAFEIEVTYKIHGRSDHLFGDGMAIWLTQEKYKPGNAMGASPVFKGLGLFIDTYPNNPQNRKFPHVSLMYNDGTKTYDHENDNLATALGSGCDVSAINSKDETKIKLIYVKGKFIEVHTSLPSGDWQLCARAEGITLQSAPFVGFSAATGQVHGVHDLLKVQTRRLSMQQFLTAEERGQKKYPEPSTVKQSNYESARGAQKPRVFMMQGLLFKMGILGMVVLILWYIWRTLKNQRQQKYF